MRSIPKYLWALACLSAVLQLLPFPLAGTTPVWCRIICWFCLVPLLQALLSNDRSGVPLRPLQTTLIAYLSGVIWYMGNCYWIYRTMHVYENIPAVASFGILLLFSLYVGLYHALFGWTIGVLRAKYSRTLVLAASPFLWVAVELARARITGFPWDLLGYTQVDNLVLTRLAPYTGVMGLSFVVAAVNALWLMRITLRKRRSLYACWPAAAVLTAAATAATMVALPRSPQSSDAVATLVQENLGVGNEASTAHETKQQMLASFSELSLRPSVPLPPIAPGQPVMSNLIAWPEAPTDFVDSDPLLRQSISSLAVRASAPVIVNAVAIASTNVDGRPNLYNSASFFAANGTYMGHYDKMHLVPFGEYTPYKPLFFFVGHLLDDLLFVPGTQRTLFRSAGRSYGVFICYESIFGNDIRRLAGDGAQVLVNISDDGWYGDTSAPFEHLDMVRMRAIENNRWIIRSTNTGITVAIDPLGRITSTFPRHIRGSLQVRFGFIQNTTLYTRFGDWFAWLCVVLSAAFLLLSFNRSRASLAASEELSL